ncbi:hypothetical protein P5V15_013347 [Pogonomyrmex californicus]
MAEKERLPSFSEKDGTNVSQSKDTYVPEESTLDISISLLDIQMSETPESTKGQISDGDTSRLESPKTIKPVLGKIQAKKRLMAFANQFKVLSKSNVKPNLFQHSTGTLKIKDKALLDDTNISKSRKKTEEKILAIEEIRREESKSKMLLAEAMATASMEDENCTSKNISGLFENTRYVKEKNKHERTNNDRKNKSIDQKYSKRYRHCDKINKDLHQDVKDRNGNIEPSTQKSPQDRERHKKDKKKKDDKDKRDNNKSNAHRDKKEEGKGKKEKEEETREKNEGIKNKKENIKERGNDMLEMKLESKDKQDKNKWKEKLLLKCTSWAEIRKSGLTLDDIIHLKRRDNSERSVKVRLTQDYTRYLEQMLMLSNHRLKRQALLVDGLDGPKKYPPESIKLTKRARGLQLLYCENPRVSLLLSISQLLQIVTPERRERIRDICEASLPRINIEEIVQQKRNWYQQINAIKYHKDIKWQMSIQFPKSKWDSEDDETSIIAKKEVKKPTNKTLLASINQQEEKCSTSNIMDENKFDNNVKDIKADNEANKKIIENMTTNDETSTSSGNEKLASEYEQFMKMVCTADMTKEYSPKKNPIKSTSHSYHEFNIESNLIEDNTNMEILLNNKFDEKDKLQTLEGLIIKSTECEESTLSTDCQIPLLNEHNMQTEHINKNGESEDSKSIPSDWENVRIKVERLSDENSESKEIKKKKQKKMTVSSDSSNISLDSEKHKKKKKRKRKILSNSSSSDSDSTDSSSSSSDSSSSEERRKKKRKKKKIGKKRRKVRRVVRTKRKKKRKMSTDSNSSDSDEHIRKKKRINKKIVETKSIIDGDINKIISKSTVILSPSDRTKVLHSVTPVSKKVKKETDENRESKLSTEKVTADMSGHNSECLKQKKESKENPGENFIEQWEMDSMMAMQQNDGDTSSQDHIGELEKMDGLEKSKYRRRRKHSRDNVQQDKDKSSKDNEEKFHEKKVRSDEEVEAVRKKRKEKEKDVRTSAEFLVKWEKEGERITQQMIQNKVKNPKKIEKQKKEKWGETDFDTLNVPSLTQLEKEVYEKQLLADEWEVDSLEAISDLTMGKRKNSQSSLKKIEKEVRYDKKTDTYIAIEKESIRELKKRQERLCAIRIWEEEQEEGEREEMMLLEQKNKRKRDDWDIEEESFLHRNIEETAICKVNDIVEIGKEWTKIDEEKNIKEDINKLLKPSSKRVKKSRWDMGSQSEEQLDAKDIWEEEYAEWTKINNHEQELEKTKKEFCTTDYSEKSIKSNMIDFYHKKAQNRELLEKSWTSEEVAIRLEETKKDVSMKHLISTKTNEEQLTSIKKEHQARNQLENIFESDVKFKEKIMELYSPSSPALSQKSQDIEVSNDSNGSNLLNLDEKREKKILITADKLSIPMSDISLQLTKLHDIKYGSKTEKIGEILNKVQLEDKDSTHDFDLKKADNLFDDLSMNELCPKIQSSEHMDIFAECGTQNVSIRQHTMSTNVSSRKHTKGDEANEGKNALKLIPKQLLIRRTNEQVKPKRILEAPLQNPAQHAAALLTIQKKLLESHALKNDIRELPNAEQTEQLRHDIINNSEINTPLDTEFDMVSKSSETAIRRSKSPVSEKAIFIRSELSENYDKESKNSVKKNSQNKTSRNLNDTNFQLGLLSPVREHRRKSPNKKESEKQYSYNKDKNETKSDDIEKSDAKDTRSYKADFVNKRKLSPLGRERRRRSKSPHVSWESESGSPGPGSWSRSHSRSPKKKDEATTSTRDRDKKKEKYDNERSSRSWMDEKRERYARSPICSTYNEDNFRKHGTVSSKSNRDDWNRKRHMDRDYEKDTRSYDSIEILRDRTMESEKYRHNRFHTEELNHTFWQYENSNILRDSNESMDSYAIGQDLPLEYDDRVYYRERSLERDMIQFSPKSLLKYRRRSNIKKERQWEKDKDSLELDRHRYPEHRLRNRTPPRSRYSPIRQAPERFRRKSRSRSRSWSPLRSRTRSRSRSESRSRSMLKSKPIMRSQSRSRSRSPLDTKSREKSISMLKLRSPEHGFRITELQSSRSSPGMDRLNEIGRERKNEDENKKFSTCGERGRRIETIVQSGVTSATSILNSEMDINSNMDTTVANFQYANEIEDGNEYYYSENNLTYPPCMDESSTSSPKRLSLDDRLELELGIKKHGKDSTDIIAEYTTNFNPNIVAYPSSPSQQQQQMIYRQQPTVVQVGNVLQVVPADFNGAQLMHREVPAAIVTPPVRSGSSQVVRVGNVLQVVPTSLDWSNNGNDGSNGDDGSGGNNSSNSGGNGSGSGGGSGSGSSNNGQSSSTTDQLNGILYSSTVPATSPSTSSISMSVPIPVPVPLPVPPTLPATSTLAPITTISPAAPLPLSLPVPVPVPIPIPSITTAFSRNEIQPQKIVQPVYNYEAILETRRKEREERKRLRELRRKEKERRRIERVNRRALRLLEKNKISRQTSGLLLDHYKDSVMDPSVLKALKEGEEVETGSPLTNSIKKEEAIMSIKEDDEDVAVDEEEDDDEDEVEAEAEDDEEEEEEAEDEDEDDDDEKQLQINQRIEVDEIATIDINKDHTEIKTKKDWPKSPFLPLKSILVIPGFRKDEISNGNLDDLFNTDDDTKDDSNKDEEINETNEFNKDAGSAKSGKLNLTKLKITKNKKSVQFADGVKPGEGTSPSGGEGDMPSPPPPKAIVFREGFKDLRRDKFYNSRKSRKHDKRARPPKAKKKVKVKIIKLKKPRITPLTAMMMDDSDEMDDRSPPPPPPGSPPPPHLWPTYLSIYNTTVRAVEQPQTVTTILTPVQAPPPPTPLPLLIPPPPLNYTIQPCSKS